MGPKPISSGKWCDYCACADCQEGDATDSLGYSWKQHGRYECEDGTHICSVCYADEPCYLSEPNERGKRSSVFCDKHPECEHKPAVKGRE